MFNPCSPQQILNWCCRQRVRSSGSTHLDTMGWTWEPRSQDFIITSAGGIISELCPCSRSVFPSPQWGNCWNTNTALEELIHSWFGESSLHTPSPDSSAAALVTALKSSKMLRSRGKLQILPVKWQLAWKDHESPAAGWIGRGRFSRVFNGGKLKE